ncbi:phage tail protein, partial [Budvicia aquatica]|uniref:phage tail protein n=1 Tax=Budvicia aquatica TaxID=82979 RepID=UPI0021C3494F
MALTIEQEQALLALLNEKKITLSELPAATGISEDDLMLIRQGILDKSVNSSVMKRHFTPAAASLTESGITKLSNAINSDDDYIAATSKAVKTAHDLAIKASADVSSKSLSKSANLSDVSDVDAVLKN